MNLTHKPRSNRSALLLIEMIVAILFFSLISAMCLKLFVKSHSVSQDTDMLDGAVTRTVSAAEQLQHGITPRQRGGSTYAYYDKDFAPCSESESAYYLEIASKESKDAAITWQLDFYRAEEADASQTPVYQMELVTYEPITP